MKKGLVSCLALSVWLSGTMVVSADDSIEKEQRKEREELVDAEESLDKDQYSLNQTVEEIKELEEELDYINERFLLIDEKRGEKRMDLVEANNELADVVQEAYQLEQDLVGQEKEMRDRLGHLYKNTESKNWLRVFLESTGISEWIQNANAYETVVESDQRIVNTYTDTVRTIQDRKSQMEDVVKDIERMMRDLKGYESDLERLEEEKEEAWGELRKKEDRLKEEVQKGSQNVKDIQETLDRLAKLKERQEALEKEKERKRKEAEMKAKQEDVAEEVDKGSEEETEGAKEAVGSPESDQKDVEKEEVTKGSIDEIIEKASNTYGVPFALIKGLIEQESRFNVDAYNDQNRNGTIDRGIMQLNSNTAPWLADRYGVEYYVGIEFVPELAIPMGTQYLMDHWEKGKGVDYTLTAYNRGAGGASTFYEKNGTYESSYSRKVKEYMKKYE